MTALVRNLATMTRVGVLAPGSDGTAKAVAQLGDRERIRKARVHPIALLAALRTYAVGPRCPRPAARGRRCRRSSTRSTPRSTRRSRTSSRPASGSCSRSTCRARWRSGSVAGVPGLTPRDASAALALVTAATETRYETVGFFAGTSGWTSGRLRGVAGRADGITPLAISPRQRLDDAVRTVSNLPFGGTDCALPMLYALEHEREIDAFVIYTDSETWAGDVHPAQALRGLPPRLGHRRPAGRGRHGLERLLHRRPERPGTCSTSSASTPRRRS